MTIRLEDFRRHWRLRADPFDPLAAEQEPERLAVTFYRSESFMQLASLAHDPRPVVVFGGAGLGKTAARSQLEREISLSQPPLVVTIDGRMLLESALPLAPQAHIMLIAQQTVLQIQAAYATARPAQIELGQYRQQPMAHAPSGRSLLRTIADTASLMQFSGIHVYFDCPSDSAPPGDLARVAELLRPLLDDPLLLSGCGFSFRLFLPDKLRPLLDPQVFSSGQVRSFTLACQTSDLIEILRIRLADASRVAETSSEGYVDRFATFLHRDDISFDSALATAAGTPRRMFELAKLVIMRHCADISDPRQPIAPDLFQAVLREHGLGPPPSSLGIGAMPAPPLGLGSRPIGEADPGVPKLTLHEDGSVFVGDESLGSLSKMIRRAITILWKCRGASILYEEFEKQLYDDDIVRGDPKSAREHLITRLRERLESKNPNARRSRTYIDTLHGTGYALRNFHPPRAGDKA